MNSPPKGMSKLLNVGAIYTTEVMIGYGPTLRKHVVLQIQREGNLVTKDLEFLIDLVAP